MLVITLWVLAMISGLSWPRWSTAALTVAVAIAVATTRGAGLQQWSGWLEFVLLLGTPWLSAVQRDRAEEGLKATQQRESDGLSKLQEVARRLLRVQTSSRELESDITHITDMYHVTKDTAGALHLQELFQSSLAIAPRLLNTQGLRLIDLSREKPAILRAARSADGRLVPSNTNSMVDMERKVIDQTRQTGGSMYAEGHELDCLLPDGVSHVAWAPLVQEQKPIGVLVAENLPKEQLQTLSVVANQLSLQLSRIHLYEQVESMAVTDALTGLFVRRYFLERTRDELIRAKHHDLACTLLMVDLDHFKEKNDRYGHLVGDVVLRDVAQLLKGNLREIDLIARYGGEEFILLLVETNVEQAVPIAERLRQLVEIHPVRAYDEVLAQTVSIGAAGYPDDAKDLEALIERSDHALYAAKHAGRNRVARAVR